jgi:hypothetical protein
MSNLKLFICLVLEFGLILFAWGSIICIQSGFNLIAAFLIVHVLFGVMVFYRHFIK